MRTFRRDLIFVAIASQLEVYVGVFLNEKIGQHLQSVTNSSNLSSTQIVRHQHRCHHQFV